MVVEKLIKEHGVITHRSVQWKFSGSTYVGYVYDGSVTPYSYEWRYFYDGCEFVIGKLIGMVEVTSHFKAVTLEDISGPFTINKTISKFKEKLLRSGKDLPTIIRDIKLKNLTTELWLVNSLII